MSEDRIYKIIEGLKGRMDSVEISKETKRRLAEVFGRRNVSVRLDRGTAYGWVVAKIKIPRPKGCKCNDPNALKRWNTCLLCHEKAERARDLAHKATKGIPFHRYTDDMGYEHDEFAVEIEFVNHLNTTTSSSNKR